MRKHIKTILAAMVVALLVVTNIAGVYACDQGDQGNGQTAIQQQNDENNSPNLIFVAKNNGKQLQKAAQNVQKSINKLTKQFNDVQNNFWGYQAIQDLVGRGVIAGFPDGSFKPNDSVTRSQFASMLVKALNLTSSDTTQTFADVPTTSWDYKAVQAAKSYLTGYSVNGTLYFYGSRNSVREDMAVALVKALNLPLQTENGQLAQKFTDSDSISANLKNYVYTAYVNGIMTGSGDKFNAQGNLTRAEAATLLSRVLQKVVVGDNGEVKVVVGGTTQTGKDTIATLSSLQVNGTALANFTSSNLTYSVVLPAGTTALPVVTANVTDTGKANAVVTQATSLPGSATVVVTAEDQTTKMTYAISFSVAAAPKDTDATLSSVSVNGNTLSGFAAGTLTYNIVLPAGTTAIPAVAATVADTGKATAVITQATALPGSATIVVTAEDQTTKKTYVLNFSVAPAPKDTIATLSSLLVNGTALTGFNSNILAYAVVLPAGTTAIPSVAATVTDTGKAAAVITQAAALPGTATIVVTAEDGVTKMTYTISFTVLA